MCEPHVLQLVLIIALLAGIRLPYLEAYLQVFVLQEALLLENTGTEWVLALVLPRCVTLGKLLGPPGL